MDPDGSVLSRRILRVSGLTAAMLAEKAGVNDGQVCNMLHGRRRASPRLLSAWRELGVERRAREEAIQTIVEIEAKSRAVNA